MSLKILLIIPPLLLSVACSLVPAVQTSRYSVSTDSYGPVQLGVSVREVTNLLQGYESNESPYDEKIGCYYVSNEAEPNSVSFMIVDDRVVRVDVTEESGIKTDRMIGIGSHKRDVLAAYQEVSISEHPYLGDAGEYLSISLDKGNALIFETYQDQVSSYRLGLYPFVGYIEGCS